MKKHKNIKTVSSTTELADLLGLSRWTVSRALNGHAAVSPDTATLIKETASQHGFSPNILGRSLRTGKTNLIGVCFPPLLEYALSQKISRLHNAIESCGFHSVMQMTGGSQKEENAVLERFASMRYAGIFLFASHLESDCSGMRSLAASQIPIVLIDPVIEAVDHPVVITDRSYGVATALKHFHSLGHRRVVAMGFRETGSYAPQRMLGIKRGCKALGWSVEENIHFLNDDRRQDDFEMGTRLAKKYLAIPGKRISAILTINGRIALAAMQVLHDHGIEAPRDVSIISNGNADYLSYYRPALTTIDYHEEKLMDSALQLLPLTNKKLNEVDRIVVRPRLIVRESTGKPPKGSF
ncbi:MAG: LacI family DNA-binding transcriptional regulator [Chthoniobacterales bacterium]